MRERYMLIWLVILVSIFIILSVKRKLSSLVKILLLLVLVSAFFIGGNFININNLSKEDQERLNEVVDKVGDTYIKLDGSSILVQVKGEWLDLNKIKVVQEFTQDVVIEYEGRDIYLGHSGVYNTIKVLQDVGLIEDDD